jgi:hypothetical protein
MKSGLGNESTASEILFERYLATHGYSGLKHEEPVEGKSTTPDYALPFRSATLYFEVKEFAPSDLIPGYKAYDAYGPVREKINQAARQFKYYKENSCSLVLANPKGAFVALEPWAILGAMLGNLGFTVPLGRRSEETLPHENTFLHGGKMIDYLFEKPRNATISAVIVLDHYPLRDKSCALAIREKEVEQSRKLTVDEVFDLPSPPSLSSMANPLRVVVLENPFARIPLPRDIFQGPFDEWWGMAGQNITQLFVGEEILRVEDQLRQTGAQ